MKKNDQLKKANQKIDLLENALKKQTNNISFFQWIKLYFYYRHNQIKKTVQNTPAAKQSDLPK